MTTVEEPCPQPMSAARAPDIVQVLLLLGRLYEGRPDRARAGFQLLTEEPIEEPVGASAVAIGLQHGQAAADRAEIEALVLLVAAAERVPAKSQARRKSRLRCSASAARRPSGTCPSAAAAFRRPAPPALGVVSRLCEPIWRMISLYPRKPGRQRRPQRCQRAHVAGPHAVAVFARRLLGGEHRRARELGDTSQISPSMLLVCGWPTALIASAMRQRQAPGEFELGLRPDHGLLHDVGPPARLHHRVVDGEIGSR